jgi:hypothetical protein
MRRQTRRHTHVGYTVLAFVVALGALGACRKEQPRYTGPYQDQVNAAMPKIEGTIGLPFKAMPKVEDRTLDELREYIERSFGEDVTPLELKGLEQAYKLFGLLPDTLDLRSAYLSILLEQVVGYYDPAGKTLFVMNSAAPEVRSLVVSHELIHALQDQYTELDSTRRIRGDNDRRVARHTAFEGQATYEGLASTMGGVGAALQLPGGWDRAREAIRSGQASGPRFAGAPAIIRETALFPYMGGMEFVRRVRRARPGEALYADLPLSTEQILHPERYLDSVPDIPTRIALGAPAAGALMYEDNLGEFEIRVLLYEHTRDQALATQGGAGWDGDRYQIVNTSGGPALAWVTVWDTSVEAAEFRDVMERAIGRRHRVRPGTGGEGTTRRWTTARRRILLSMESVGGRPAVIFEDAPVSIATRLLDVPRIVLTER